MAPSNALKRPPKVITYMITHIFLPPQVPSENDLNPEYEQQHLTVTERSLRDFLNSAPDDYKRAVESALDMVATSGKFHVAGANRYVLVQDALGSAMKDLPSKRDGCLVLQVSAQNAAVIMSNKENGVLVEVFEVSPTNEKVISTKGRLRRSFPGSGVLIPHETFRDEGFGNTIASTIAKMSNQRAPGTQPKVRKASKMHDEDRDTTEPKIVTELLMSILNPLGTSSTQPAIWKNTRDEVSHLNAHLPWRRSPIWLVLRVSLQLVFRRISDTDEIYKEFMIYHMARFLHSSLEFGYHSDLIFVMSAKIHQRLQKINFRAGVALNDIKTTLRKAAQRLQNKWQQIHELDAPSLPLARVTRLDLVRDTAVELPGLKNFIDQIRNRSANQARINFRPKFDLAQFNPHALPTLRAEDEDGTLFELMALESWVGSNLTGWLNANRIDVNACEKLRFLAEEYYRKAKAASQSNPEVMSMVILTALELWVGLDKAATHFCPLLNEYHPGIPTNILQSLLLPTREHMERLQAVEEYIGHRESRSTLQFWDAVGSIGTEDSFSNKFFLQSQEHQQLKRRIETWAAECRDQTESEFVELRRRYDEYVRIYDSTECEMVDVREGREERMIPTHSSSCQRCQSLSSAQKLTISIHEWPLPSDTLEAQSIVFELVLPTAFGHWREATVFTIDTVLGCSYETESARCEYIPETYRAFSGFFQRTVNDQTIVALSENKPHAVTHRRNVNVGSTTIDEICLGTGLNYRYFDTRKDSYIGRAKAGDKLKRQCTYRIPSGSSTLQSFLERGPKEPSGPAPNTVIASQNVCPAWMSLEEYKGLFSLPLGFRIQWLNILVQLRATSVNLNCPKATLVILQCIHQGGPQGTDDTLRQSHAIMQDERLAPALLVGLEETLSRIEGNWQAWRTLFILVSLACRVHTLTTNQQHRDFCVRFLKRARAIGVKWTSGLQQRTNLSTVDEERAKLGEKCVNIALVCACSFQLDTATLTTILTCPDAASTLIQSSILIQEGQKSIDKSRSETSLLYHRWKHLSFKAQEILAERIVDNGCPSLDRTIHKVWPAYHPAGPWRRTSAPHQYWLENRNTGGDLQVHFNLLSGELLVNGLPLGRLPSGYETHKDYLRLFGRARIDVMPSGVPGLRFSGKNTFAGYTLHFGMGEESELLVRAEKDGRSFELVSRKRLLSRFPTAFVQGHVHWYGVAGQKLLFVKEDRPWDLASAKWTLLRRGTGAAWKLVSGSQALINVSSETSKTMAEVFKPLQDISHIHCFYDEGTAIMEIELPRLELAFYLRKGTDKIYSRQYRGRTVDENQQLGSLTGLRSKLLLRAADLTKGRMAIIPHGKVIYDQSGGHVSIQVDKSSASMAHGYRIDDRLGTIVPREDQLSRLYLCYLHALTSFCLPDPLTGRTGTEAALTILKSAAVRSFDRLEKPVTDVLRLIAGLTPKRKCYPVHTRVMQGVQWSNQLSFLSQHGAFQPAVQSLFHRHSRSRLFYPEDRKDAPSLESVDAHLLERDDIRSSTFRTEGFGAERFTREHDVVYKGRDGWQDSEASHRVVAMVNSVLHGSRHNEHKIHGDLADRIWNYLAVGGSVDTREVALNTSELTYDARWLSNPCDYISENLVKLHRVFSTPDGPVNKFTVATWLSTMAYGTEDSVAILYTLAKLFRNPSAVQDDLPKDRFLLSSGTALCRPEIVMSVKAVRVDISQSPEAALPREPQESGHSYYSRRKRIFEAHQNEALEKLVDAIVAQGLRAQLDRGRIGAGNNQWSRYFNTGRAINNAEPKIQAWYRNSMLRRYINRLVHSIAAQSTPLRVQSLSLPVQERRVCSSQHFVAIDQLFSGTAPHLPGVDPPDLTWALTESADGLGNGHSALKELITKLETTAASLYEESYVESLERSHDALQERQKSTALRITIEEIKMRLTEQRQVYKVLLDEAYSRILQAVGEPAAKYGVSLHWPRLSPTLLLAQLSHKRWRELSPDWKDCLVRYALALSYLQQTDRRLRCCNNAPALIKELANTGHQNWDPSQNPQFLLLEIEADITIRSVQQDVAARMSSGGGPNQVMQLNMGEGKSSVIVPMIATELADGNKLVRVVVAKPQAKQMSEMLVSKLGGLQDRPVFHMPFSRAVNPGVDEVRGMRAMLDECIREGGVLLVQPEHILSFKLMAIERVIAGDDVGQDMLETLHFLDVTTRDVVDESDENFSVKFELVYTLGSQQPIDHSPDRWSCIHEVLDLIRRIVPAVREEVPDAMQVVASCQGGFPRTRILQEAAEIRIMEDIATRICEHSLHGFPISAQPQSIRHAVHTYISKADLTVEVAKTVEESEF